VSGRSRLHVGFRTCSASRPACQGRTRAGHGSHVYVFAAEGRTPAEPLPDVAECRGAGEAADHVEGLADVAVTVAALKDVDAAALGLGKQAHHAEKAMDRVVTFTSQSKEL
jgi:hypothetical protein